MNIFLVPYICLEMVADLRDKLKLKILQQIFEFFVVRVTDLTGSPPMSVANVLLKKMKKKIRHSNNHT